MKIVGARDSFAIEYGFLPDPDDGKAALPEESLSWGCFSIWVNGLNICQSSYNNETTDTVSWYLYPFLCWLARNWEPLLYEEQPPVPTEKNVARAMFFEYAKQSFGFMSEEQGIAWYNWGQRHSLRACSNGGIFPDLFIRAFGDSIEFSWGNSEIPGVPVGMFFTAPYGSQEIERHKVKNVLSTFLIDATKHLTQKMPSSLKFKELHELSRKTSAYDINKQLQWMIPILRDKVLDNDTLMGKIKKFITSADENYIPAPVLMFGSLSPAIHEQDVDIIINAIHEKQNDHSLSEFVKRAPIPNKNQHESGYSLSLDFIEDFFERYDLEANVENIIDKLDIAILHNKFSDRDMRGIAMAGKNIAPTIFVNMSHPNNFTKNGERFTIAHEICHLLFDRQYGQEVGISSGPWAPSGVEKRANAFAAMLLMPPEVIESKLGVITDISCFEDVLPVANDLHVSMAALIEHLYNLGAIGISERDKLREENIGYHKRVENHPNDQQ